MSSSCGPPVDVNRTRAHSVQLSTPEMIRLARPLTPKSKTKTSDIPKRNLQLFLGAPSNELEKWKPSDPETLRVLRFYSNDWEKDCWTYADLADLVVKYDYQKHVNKVMWSRGERPCFEHEVGDKDETQQEAGSLAVMSLAELQEENNQLKHDISCMSNQIEYMEEHNPDWSDMADAHGENEALQEEVDELQDKIRELEGLQAAQYLSTLREKQIVQTKLRRERIAMKTRLGKERKGMKAKLTQEKRRMAAILERSWSKIDAQIEQERVIMKAQLEQEGKGRMSQLKQERDEYKAKPLSSQGRLALILAEEEEDDPVKVRYTSLKRKLALMLVG